MQCYGPVLRILDWLSGYGFGRFLDIGSDTVRVTVLWILDRFLGYGDGFRILDVLWILDLFLGYWIGALRISDVLACCFQQYKDAPEIRACQGFASGVQMIYY
jgi:hypothetical protein